MDKRKEFERDKGICNVRTAVLKYSAEVVDVSEQDISLFHKVYREIGEQLGIEVALQMHDMFKGTQVNFPVRFFDIKCVKEMIIQEYNGKNVKMLARKYDYSEKTIRRIIKESVSNT